MECSRIINIKQLTKGVFSFVLLAAVLLSLSVFSGCSKSENYTKENIMQHCGFEKVGERKFTINRIECDNYFNPGVKTSDYCYLDFYVFDSSLKAKAAYRYMRRNWISEVTDEGEKYICGHEKGVMDADVVIMIYVNKNLIITAPLSISSGFTDGSGEGTEVFDNADYQERIKSMILNEW